MRAATTRSRAGALGLGVMLIVAAAMVESALAQNVVARFIAVDGSACPTIRLTTAIYVAPGSPVGQLTGATVLENGEPRAATVSRGSAGSAIAILIDAGGAVSAQDLADLKQGAHALVSLYFDVPGGPALKGMSVFSVGPTVSGGAFQSGRAQIESAIDAVTTTGGDPDFYSAVVQAAATLREVDNSLRSIVVLTVTDSHIASGAVSQGTAISASFEAKAPIFAAVFGGVSPSNLDFLNLSGGSYVDVVDRSPAQIRSTVQGAAATVQLLQWDITYQTSDTARDHEVGLQFNVLTSQFGSVSGTSFETQPVLNCIDPPDVTITLPSELEPAHQEVLSFDVLSGGFPVDVSGTASFTFTPDDPTFDDDPDVRFIDELGGRTTNFAIPAGEESWQPGIAIQTGSLAGTIDLTLDELRIGARSIPRPLAAIPPVRVPPQPPLITDLKAVKTDTGWAACLTGASTPREVIGAKFELVPSGVGELQTTMLDLTSIAQVFSTWYEGDESRTLGSKFLYRQDFTTNGPITAVDGMRVTLRNSLGEGNTLVIRLEPFASSCN